jgi:hypothetical protein
VPWVREGSRWRPSAPAATAVLLTLVVMAPALAAVVQRFGSDYVPVQDLAIIDLRVRDVWSANVPLVGPYSKGWNHPGPLLFWLLAVPSGMFGQAAWATAAGGALLQAGAIAGSARLAWRKGGLALLLLVLAVLGLSYSATGGWMVMDAWNPNVAFPFFVLYVLAVWALADGARWAPVVVTAVGTFLVQTHVGYLPLVAVGAAAAVAMLVLDARRRGESLRPWRRPLGWSLAVGALLWLAPVFEQLTTPTGNLTRMFRYFGDGGGETAGLGRALELLAAEFRPLPPWLGGGGVTRTFTGVAERVSAWWLLVPVALLAVGAVATRRTGARSDRNLVVLLAALSLAGVLAVRQSPSTIEPYLFRWRVPLAVLVVAGVLWTLARWTGMRRWPWAWRAAGAVLVVAAVVPSVELVRQVADAPEHLSRFEVAVADAAEQLEDGGAFNQPAILRFEGSNAGGLWGGLVDELDRRGLPVRVDRALDYQFGRHRRAKLDRVGTVLYAVDEGHLLSVLGELPDAEVVAEVAPLSDRDEAAMTAAQRRLARVLVREGRAEDLRLLNSNLLGFALAGVPGLAAEDIDTVARLTEVVRREGPCRCGVVAFPSDSPSLERIPELDPRRD